MADTKQQIQVVQITPSKKNIKRNQTNKKPYVKANNIKITGNQRQRENLAKNQKPKRKNMPYLQRNRLKNYSGPPIRNDAKKKRVE